jgi:hypothetical protein
MIGLSFVLIDAEEEDAWRCLGDSSWCSETDPCRECSTAALESMEPHS